jgi:predicted ATPase
MQGCLIITTMREGAGMLDTNRCQAEDKHHIHIKVKNALDAILHTPSLAQITLQPFTSAEVSLMLKMLLPGVAIHESNVDLICQKTHGHPVHIEQIAYYIESMGDSAHVKLMQPGSILSSDLQKISASSMNHVIVSRVDWLRPSEQLTLKVCSVLGPTVSLSLLLRTYPLAQENEAELRKMLLDNVTTLCRENFLRAESTHTEVWRWHSTVARDVIYGIIPFNQRRLLHSRLATALEDIVQENSNIAPRSHIAYHWAKSCNGVEVVEWQRTLKAMESWKMAANEMDVKGAYLDAVRFMTKSLELSRVIFIALQKREVGEHAALAECLKQVDTLEIAHQHAFNANMYYKMVQADLVRSRIH